MDFSDFDAHVAKMRAEAERGKARAAEMKALESAVTDAKNFHSESATWSGIARLYLHMQKAAELSALKFRVQAQAAELRILAMNPNAQKTDLDAQKTDLDAQKTDLDAQKTDLDAQKTDLDAQATKLAEMVETLRKKAKNKGVSVITCYGTKNDVLERE